MPKDADGNAFSGTAGPFLGENFNSLFGMLIEGAYCVDNDRRIRHWNHAAERITGYSAREVVGSHCFSNILKHTDKAGRELCSKNELCPLYMTILDGIPREARVSLCRRDGRCIPVFIRTVPLSNDLGNRVGALELFEEDGTVENLREQLADMSRTAYMDSLTGLPNRRFIDIRLEQCLQEWERYGWPFAFFIADIDRFKDVNDTHGHHFGDKVLSMVANTFAMTCRGSDMVGRWGGDEMAGILKNVDGGRLDTLLRRMNDAVRQTVIDNGRDEVKVTTSIGGTMVKKGDTAKSILERADCGLYMSKQAGRDRYLVL